ncbi:hypothetical protein BGZ65_001011, partial [Modicella reniformis]
MFLVNKEFDDDEIWDGGSDEEDSRKFKQINLTTVEAILAQFLVNKTMKQAFADKDDLPAWFPEDDDISDKEKSIGISKLLAKAGAKEVKESVQLVVMKRENKENKGRPNSINGT